MIDDMAKKTNGRITCPYCLESFDQHQVVFRASKGYSDKELNESAEHALGGLLAGIAQNGDSKDIRQLFRKFDLSTEKENAYTDAKLMNFWSKRGGKDGFIYADPEWDFPHIDPSDPDTFWKMVSLDPVGDKVPDQTNGFLWDGDFITGVFDVYSNGKPNTVRLCPRCHNPLPLKRDYGKYPTMFISVIGMTSSGKTVLLNQLLNNLNSALHGSNYRVAHNNLADFGKPLSRGNPLPGSTDDKVFRRPLVVMLEPREDRPSQTGLTLVFYDIAGELCLNKNGDPELAKAQNAIGLHIAHSDALLVLIDPNQIPVFAQSDMESHSIDNMISVVNQIRQNELDNTHAWQNTPVAVCITKSDKLRKNQFLDPDLPIFHNPETETGLFDWESNRAIHRYLRRLLRDHCYSSYAALETFHEPAYFMVSAINCGAESRVQKYQNWYILDDKSVQAFQNLRIWCSEWNRRTPEERKYFRPCQVKTKDGKPIEFPVEQKIEQKEADAIETEIVGVTSHDMSINLTLWDVMQNLSVVSFPKSEPNHFRVCEPLKWILWKKGELAPHYVKEIEPQQGLFERKKRFQERYNAYIARNEKEYRKFHWNYQGND